MASARFDRSTAPPPVTPRGTPGIEEDTVAAGSADPSNPRQTSPRPGRATAHPRRDGSLPTLSRHTRSGRSVIRQSTRWVRKTRQSDQSKRQRLSQRGNLALCWRTIAQCTSRPLGSRPRGTWLACPVAARRQEFRGSTVANASDFEGDESSSPATMSRTRAVSPGRRALASTRRQTGGRFSWCGNAANDVLAPAAASGIPGSGAKSPIRIGS